MLRPSSGRRRICHDLLSLDVGRRAMRDRGCGAVRGFSAPTATGPRSAAPAAPPTPAKPRGKISRTFTDNDRLPAFLMQGQSSTIREVLRKWEEEVVTDERDFNISEAGSPHMTLNDMYKTAPQSSLREGREVALDDESLEGLDPWDDGAVADMGGVLQPGTLVELRGSDSRVPILAVIVGYFHSTYYYFSNSGQLIGGNRMRAPLALFSSPGFCTPSEIQPLVDYLVAQPEEDILPERLPTHQPAPEVGSAIRRKLVDFYNRANTLYQQNLDALSQAEKKLTDPVETKVTSLEDVVRVLMPSRTDPSRAGPSFKPGVRQEQGKQPAEGKSPQWDAELLYAVHTALLDNEACAFQSLNSLTTVAKRSDLYLVASAKSIRSAYKIRDQVRVVMSKLDAVEGVDGNQTSWKVGPDGLAIWSFIRKARRLVQASRKQRAVTTNATIAPFADRYPATWDSRFDEWTSEEKEILEFMEGWISTKAHHQYSMLDAVGASILRLVNMYRAMDSLNSSTAFTFLKEVGWIPSWELPLRYYRQIPGARTIPGGGYHRQEPEHLSTQVCQDRAAGHRKKVWSSVKAYAIDGADTHVIDDAISLEPTENPDEFWIHSHIADPTAFIKHDSALANYLAILPENLYTPGYFVPMFPPSFADEASRDWGIGKGKPCLTFSSRVDRSGKVVDYTVQAGVLGEVVYMDTSDVLDVFPHLRSTPVSTVEAHKLAVGRPLEAPPAPPPNRHMTTFENLSPGDRGDMETLYQLLKANDARRFEKGAATRPRPSKDVRLGFDGEWCDRPANVEDRSTWSGDPSISVSVVERGDGNLVSAAMMLAGESAAKWCSDRGIPIPFFGQPLALLNSSLLRDLASRMNALVARGVPPPTRLMRAYDRAAGVSCLSVQGQPVVTLGLDMYVKATSPLRRFTDCVAHWQMHGALAEEARTGRSLAGTNCSDAPFLPWTRQALASKLTHLTHNASCARLLSSSSGSRGWIYQAVFRAWKYAEDKALPTRFLFTVVHKYTSVLTGQLDYFDLAAWMKKEDLGDAALMADIYEGDVLEVEIEHIDVFTCSTTVKAIRKMGQSEVNHAYRVRYGGKYVDEIQRVKNVRLE